MRGRRVPWGYFLALAISVTLVASWIGYGLRSTYRDARTQLELRLSVIANGRAWVVSDYLNERRCDAEVLAALPTVRALLSPRPETAQVRLARSQLQQEITDFLDGFNAVYGYLGAYLLDPEGRILAQSTNSAALGAQGAEIGRTVARDGKFEFATLGDGGTRSLLTFTMPVFAEAATKAADSRTRHVIGVVVILTDAATSLYPLVTAPYTSLTGETVVLRREGNDVVYFTPLRHTSLGPTSVRGSLDTVKAAARAALAGRETSGEFIDYRGVRAFATTRRIGLAGWGLVTKIDRDEALAQFRHTARLEVLVAGLSILAFAGLLIGYRRHQKARAVRDTIERQRAIGNEKRYAQGIVDSIPAGLLLLSPDLRVLSANRSFLESFQLRSEDVEGKALHEVLRTEALAHRASDVLHGRVTSHDVLLDVVVGGHEEKRPARITVADVVRAEEGDSQVLLVVEDLRENERLRVAAQESEQRLGELVQGLDAIVWEADATTFRFSFVSQQAAQILGYPVERWLGEPDFWLNHIYSEDRERISALCRTATAEGRNFEFEYRALAADGHVVWLRNLVRVIKGADGKPAQFRGVMFDIIGRRRAEEALQEKIAIED